MMKEFWNERFGSEEYVYGMLPNEWLKAQLDLLPSAGRLLLPAEGEGRNAVYAAECGWKVTSIDYSTSGRDKAMALAAQKGVNIEYEIGDVVEYQYPESVYDAAALIFAHFGLPGRRKAWEGVTRALKPGGWLIVEVFRKEQLGLSSGGPKTHDLLYSAEELRAEFPGIHWQILENAEVTLDEGPYHKGIGRVVRGLGQRANA